MGRVWKSFDVLHRKSLESVGRNTDMKGTFGDNSEMRKALLEMGRKAILVI